MSVLSLVFATGCSGEAVEINTQRLTPSASCADFVAALPKTINDQLRRPVTPDDAPGAAWGDPAIVLRCGVGVPADYDEFAPCLETDGVGWFVPDVADQPAAEVVLTTIGYEPNVEVRVPASYRPSGPAAVMAQLATPITRHLRLIKPCR